MTLVLASEAPDVDIVTAFRGSVSYLQHHRGITHSLVGAPFVAAGTLVLVYGVNRLLLWRGWKPKLAPNWRLLYFYALIGALVHLLLDFTNSYGVRPFAPFNYKWYSWDILFVIDPIVLTVLILALVIPALLGLVSEEIGARKSPRGRAAAIVALTCFAGLVYLRDFEHRRAVNLLNSITYNNEDPLRASAYATALNPFVWNGVVETRDFFETMVVDPRGGQIESDETRLIRAKPAETAVTLAAKKSRLGRVYLDWAQYPLVDATELADKAGSMVHFIDLRFTRTFSRGEPLPLSGYVLLDPKLKVIGMYVGQPIPVAADLRK